MSFAIRVLHSSRLIRRIKKRFTTNSETLPGIELRLRLKLNPLHAWVIHLMGQKSLHFEKKIECVWRLPESEDSEGSCNKKAFQ